MSQLTLFEREDWRAVPGFEGKYQVNRCGEVKSIHTGAKISPYPSGKNLKVELYCGDGSKTTRSVGHLVVRVFGSPPDGDWVARHIDGNKENNSLENLEAVPKWQFHTGETSEVPRDFGRPKEWVDIPGWEGLYKAHPKGHVRSLHSGKIISSTTNISNCSGSAVRLYRDGDRKRRSLAKLIILTFQDPIEKKEDWVPHYLNGDRTDCRVSNLVPLPRSLMRRTRSDTGKSDPCYRKVFNEYKSRANQKGTAFQISEDQFVELLLKDCFYCGASPTYREKPKAEVNGVDRVYSDVGYVLGNCVPCCRKCNVWKLDADPKEFVRRAIRIANRHTSNHRWIPKTDRVENDYF